MELKTKTENKTKVIANVEDKEVVKSPVQMNIEVLIGQAITQSASIETLEKLLTMRTELKKEWAKEQYDIAMASFQAECPVIVKSKEGGQTNAGVVAYHYAPLDLIDSKTKSLRNKYGFSHGYKTFTDKDGVKVVCIAKHKCGHSEESDMSIPLGAGTRVMSAPQIVASAITFAKRYAFCNVFGIQTGEEDNDAKEDAKKPKISDELIKKVKDATNEVVLREIWESNKGLGREFATLITEQKKFLLSVTKSEKEDAVS